MLAAKDNGHGAGALRHHEAGLMRQLVQESLERLGSAYRDWRYERDIAMISRALDQLNDRQLAMLGLSRAMLDVDVERLAIRAGYEQRMEPIGPGPIGRAA
jgi:hypothetical protein